MQYKEFCHIHKTCLTSKVSYLVQKMLLVFHKQGQTQCKEC